MTIHPWRDLKRERFSEGRLEEIRAEVEREILEMNLVAMRELVGQTQTEIADTMGTTPPQISRVERREDHLVSTLGEYVKALGGELEITARFGEKSIRLHGV